MWHKSLPEGLSFVDWNRGWGWLGMGMGSVIRATHARHIYEVVDLAVASVDMQSGQHMRGLLLHNFTSL